MIEYINGRSPTMGIPLITAVRDGQYMGTIAKQWGKKPWKVVSHGNEIGRFKTLDEAKAHVEKRVERGIGHEG